MKRMSHWLLIGAGLCISSAVIVYFYLTGGVSLAGLQYYARYLHQWVDTHYFYSAFVYMATYALVVVSGIPLFVPLTLLAGYLFGLVWGIVFVVIAANVGAACSFFLMRYVLYRLVQQRYADRLTTFKQRFQKQGAVYMLTLHLTMVFPYIVINTLAALAGVSFATFIWTTIVGSFPLIFLHVIAGQQLQYMSSLHNIVPTYAWLVIGIVVVLIIVMAIVINRLKRSERL